MEKKDFIKVGGGVANEKNLVPNEKRTPSERRENARKAGKASGEARRRRKAIRENMEFLLNLPPSNAKDFNKLTKAGFPVEEMDNSQLVVLALFNRAKEGDVAAIREIRNIIGKDTPVTNNNTPIVLSGEDKLEE